MATTMSTTSPLMSLNTGNKSAYNKTTYCPPVRNNVLKKNDEPRMNPFLMNNIHQFNNDKMKQKHVPAPEENTINFPVLCNGYTTNNPITTASQTQTQSQTTKEKQYSNIPNNQDKQDNRKGGYNRAARNVPQQKVQVRSIHNPNHIILSKKNLKANEPIIQAAVNEFASSRNRILNQRLEATYYQEHYENIIEEMKFKLTQNEFNAWCDRNIDESGSYKYTKSYYGSSSSEDDYDY